MPKTSKRKSTPKVSKSASARSSTPQRIVTRSIALFNRYGVQSVAIERICIDLKISPGNLTYHFPRRDDLIRAAVDVLKEHLRDALQRPVAVQAPEDGAEYLLRVMRTFWNFRFYFNALAFLLTDDKPLRREYYVFRDWLIDTMTTDIDFLTERGHMRLAIPPNNSRLLCENIYALLLNWLRTQQIDNPSAATPSLPALRQMALHLWSLSQSWMEPQWGAGLLVVFERLLADPNPSRRMTQAGPIPK